MFGRRPGVNKTTPGLSVSVFNVLSRRPRYEPTILDSVLYQYLSKNTMAKKKLTKKKFKYFQNLFLEQRKKLLSINRASEIDVDGDEVDLVQGSLLHSMEEKISQRDRLKLNNIEQALKRLEDGLFGDCNECGEPISESRLIARPECTTCISCAEELEKTSRDYNL